MGYSSVVNSLLWVCSITDKNQTFLNPTYLNLELIQEALDLNEGVDPSCGSSCLVYLDPGLIPGALFPKKLVSSEKKKHMQALGSNLHLRLAAAHFLLSGQLLCGKTAGEGAAWKRPLQT